VANRSNFAYALETALGIPVDPQAARDLWQLAHGDLAAFAQSFNQTGT